MKSNWMVLVALNLFEIKNANQSRFLKGQIKHLLTAIPHVVCVCKNNHKKSWAF